jgi:hypothetical protein
MFKDVGDGMISMLVATKHSETGIKINGGGYKREAGEGVIPRKVEHGAPGILQA